MTLHGARNVSLSSSGNRVCISVQWLIRSRDLQIWIYIVHNIVSCIIQRTCCAFCYGCSISFLWICTLYEPIISMLHYWDKAIIRIPAETQPKQTVNITTHSSKSDIGTIVPGLHCALVCVVFSVDKYMVDVLSLIGYVMPAVVCTNQLISRHLYLHFRCDTLYLRFRRQYNCHMFSGDSL